jgi:hypothetical protein
LASADHLTQIPAQLVLERLLASSHMDYSGYPSGVSGDLVNNLFNPSIAHHSFTSSEPVFKALSGARASNVPDGSLTVWNAYERCSHDIHPTSLRLPRPAGTELYEPEWRLAPNGTHTRRFATKKFLVFEDWLTVQTGGIQIMEEIGAVFVLRDMRVVGHVTSLLDSQAREFAQVLIAAASYIAELEAIAEGTGSS